MADKLMVLPSKHAGNIRLVKIPEDYEMHEVYRLATGLIAGVEAQVPDYDWEDILEVLEEKGFSEVEFILGPEV
jgi:hypothetical protein